ncbi:MAG: serine hydrolase [Bacteroidetes bacterium]|nr:serine hydrolase [Bacteroidota bacterium]MCH8523963.1 serine hydrolase [Balneolales bacterium]
MVIRTLLGTLIMMGTLACSPPASEKPLEGFTVVIDPGHGGTAETDSYRVGPAGEREEWINLRVSLMLRDLLEDAGARVILTRTEDVHVDLADRARIAMENAANLFISVHHNATADATVNFPIIYYHGNASQNRASVLLGRMVGDALREAMFNGEGPVSNVSDHTIFPTRGAGVLRGTYGIPAIISEASFFTHPAEEERLKQTAYNKIEAEALFKAINAFLLSERPERRIIEPYEAVVEPLPVFQEAERMQPEALLWKEDVAFGRSIVAMLKGAEIDRLGQVKALEASDATRQIGASAQIGASTQVDAPGDTHAARIVNTSSDTDADNHLVDEALERLLRSVRSFPDSYLAREAHLLRAELYEVQARLRYGNQQQIPESRSSLEQQQASGSERRHFDVQLHQQEIEQLQLRAKEIRLRVAEFFPDHPIPVTMMSVPIQLPDDISLSVIVQSTDGQILFEHASEKQVPSASVIKVPILAAFLQAASNGIINPNDTYILQESDIVGGEGELQRSGAGLTLTLMDYARHMIRTSDNTATNVIIRSVGMQAVNEIMREHEMGSSVLARYMMDFDAITQGRQNYTSAADMNRFLIAVLHGKVLSSEMAGLFWDILATCDDDTMLRAGAPSGVTVAHKTGILDYVRGDSGVLFGQHDYVVTMFAEDFSDVTDAEAAIADIVSQLYNNPPSHTTR